MIILEIYNVFFCHIMQYNPYTDFVKDMIAKRDRYKKERKDLLQILAEKIANSVYGNNIRKDVNDQYECVTENWTTENYDDTVKEWWFSKNGKLIFELEDDAGVSNIDIAKKINQMTCHLRNYICGHSNRLLNIVLREIDGFYSNNVCYGDTDLLRR